MAGLSFSRNLPNRNLQLGLTHTSSCKRAWISSGDAAWKNDELPANHFYEKVIKRLGKEGHIHVIRFNSMPPEIIAYFQALPQYAARRSLRKKWYQRILDHDNDDDNDDKG